jgi:hypothetical protein
MCQLRQILAGGQHGTGGGAVKAGEFGGRQRCAFDEKRDRNLGAALVGGKARVVENRGHALDRPAGTAATGEGPAGGHAAVQAIFAGLGATHEVKHDHGIARLDQMAADQLEN